MRTRSNGTSSSSLAICAGAEIDFARGDDHGAVAANCHPRIELSRIEIVRAAVGIDVRRCLAERFRQRAEDAEADNERAALDDVAARNHARACSVRAARLMARMTRRWLPQRQSTGSSARLMSASVGFGFLSSSTFAVIRMPFMQ